MLYRRADRVISPSAPIAEELARDFRVPRRLIHVINNPVDEAALRAAATPAQRRPGEGGRLSRSGGYRARRAMIVCSTR